MQAVEVLNDKGVRGMTLADVAAQIELVPTAVMYHFHRKEELAAACFHKAMEQYESMIALINAAAEVHHWAPGSRSRISPAPARNRCSRVC